MPTRPAIAYTATATATLAVAFLLHFPSLYEPRWYGDEGIFAAVAYNVRHGATLYSGAWDNKPPLIFFTYAGIQSAFGTGVFPLHLAATISVLATQIVVMAIAFVLFGARRSLVAGLLLAFGMGTPLVEGNLAMTETFMVLPASLAVLAYVLAERRPAHNTHPVVRRRRRLHRHCCRLQAGRRVRRRGDRDDDLDHARPSAARSRAHRRRLRGTAGGVRDLLPRGRRILASTGTPSPARSACTRTSDRRNHRSRGSPAFSRRCSPSHGSCAADNSGGPCASACSRYCGSASLSRARRRVRSRSRTICSKPCQHSHSCSSPTRSGRKRRTSARSRWQSAPSSSWPSSSASSPLRTRNARSSIPSTTTAPSCSTNTAR